MALPSGIHPSSKRSPGSAALPFVIPSTQLPAANWVRNDPAAQTRKKTWGGPFKPSFSLTTGNPGKGRGSICQVTKGDDSVTWIGKVK